jgi:hypothetical protein
MQIYQLVSCVIQHKQNRQRWIKSLGYALDDFKCFERLARYSLALNKQSKSWQQNMGIVVILKVKKFRPLTSPQQVTVLLANCVIFTI